MKKYLVLTAAILALAACHKKKPGEGEAAVPVTVAKAEARTVPIAIAATGTVEPIDKVNVAAQVDGLLKQILIKEGQTVKKGQPIMLIDPAPFKEALAQAQAQLKQDMDSLDYAKIQSERYAELVTKGAAAQADADQTSTAYKTAAGKVDADKAAVAQAKIDLGYTNITSPLDGKAGAFLVNEGAVVKKNDTTLITINRIAPIYVRFAVPEKYLAQIGQAQKAGPVMVNAAPEGVKPAEGKLTFVDNSVNQDTGMIMLKATFANADQRLWPGVYAAVTLTLGERKDAVVVPAIAVQTSQEGKYLFVLTAENTASMRKVDVQMTLGDDCVVSGITAGETVITDGQMLLKDGSPVQIKTAAQ